MAGRGRPKGSKNEGSYPKISIGIAWAATDKENAVVKLKVEKNKNIDEIMALNYNLPGIPKDAVIKGVVMGDALIEKLKVKFNIKK